MEGRREEEYLCTAASAEARSMWENREDFGRREGFHRLSMLAFRSSPWKHSLCPSKSSRGRCCLGAWMDFVTVASRPFVWRMISWDEDVMDSMTHPRGPFIERFHNILFCKLCAQVRGHVGFYRKGF